MISKDMYGVVSHDASVSSRRQRKSTQSNLTSTSSARLDEGRKGSRSSFEDSRYQRSVDEASLGTGNEEKGRTKKKKTQSYLRQGFDGTSDQEEMEGISGVAVGEQIPFFILRNSMQFLDISA